MSTHGKVSEDIPADDEKSWLRRFEQLAAVNERLVGFIERHLQREKDWQHERDLLRALIDQVPDYLFAKDRDSRFMVANKAVAADLGLEPSTLIGKTDFDLHPAALASKFFADEQKIVETGEPNLDIEEFVIQPTGRQKWLSTSKVAMRDSANEIVGIVGISRDVSDRKAAEAQIHHLVHHDTLTGLPNRILLMDRLGQALRHADRDGTSVAVVFVDLDRFKNVNDSFGHSAGDVLLKSVADRMVASVRSTDTVARLSGDEFVIIVDEESRDRPLRTTSLVDRVRSALMESVVIEGHALNVSCSIGVAVYPKDASDPEALLDFADIAMYHAKEGGRDMHAFYAPSMDEAARFRRQLQEGMRHALQRAEFTLLYQPQIDLTSSRVRAVEALLRWNHPELGLVMPGTFIPIAEETGMIIELGAWVVREACRQNAAWQKAGVAPIVMSVNVSARQFRDRSFIDVVKHALESTGLDPQYLELELTESLLMENVEEAVGTMKELEALGVRFSIDDFGTGYSSLSALKSFPVARLKIDRSFVDNLARDGRDRSIARAVISMAKKLHLRVIAEGVEDQDQLAFLKANHCDEAQGFLISHPVSPEEIVAIMRDKPFAS